MNKEDLIKNIIFETYIPGNTGGQSVGRMSTSLKGTIPELDISISCGYHNSQFKNRKTIVKLFNTILEDL